MINGLMALARNAPHAVLQRGAGPTAEKRPATYLPSFIEIVYAWTFGFMFMTFLGL